MVWNIFIFPYIGNNNPNWRAYFFRGAGIPPTSIQCDLPSLPDNWWGYPQPHTTKDRCYGWWGSVWQCTAWVPSVFTSEWLLPERAQNLQCCWFQWYFSKFIEKKRCWMPNTRQDNQSIDQDWWSPIAEIYWLSMLPSSAGNIWTVWISLDQYGSVWMIGITPPYDQDFPLLDYYIGTWNFLAIFHRYDDHIWVCFSWLQAFWRGYPVLTLISYISYIVCVVVKRCQKVGWWYELLLTYIEGGHSCRFCFPAWLCGFCGVCGCVALVALPCFTYLYYIPI